MACPQASSRSSPRSTWPLNLALLTASVLLGLAMGEAAVRLLRPQFIVVTGVVNPMFWQHETSFYRHDPVIGWKLVPGAEGTFSRPEFSHHVRINSAGWRDRERSLEKLPGAFRIVALGDSFTWGHGVEDDEIFTRRLESLLPGVEVLNMGLSGASTDQQLLILKHDALAYHPDLIVVMVCRNDFVGNTSTKEGPYGKPAFVLQQDGSLRPINVPVADLTPAARAQGWLRRHSALTNMIESFWNGQEDDASSRTYDRRQASYDLMRALLKSMRDEAARGGARLAIGIVPSNAHTYFDTIPPLEAERLGVIRDLGAAEDIPVLDLVPAFRAGARNPATGARIDLHYRSDQHWNRRGHELAAAELARLLRQADLIPSHFKP